MGIFRKLFLDGEWNIAIRKKTSSNDLFDYSAPFKPIPHHIKYWFADPMLFSANGKHYIFCEAYDRKLDCGKLGYFVIKENGEVGEFKECLSQNYHLSYPCVFKHDKDFYMIPESGENSSLDLYKATLFPDKWEKISSFDVDLFADPTVFLFKNKLYLFVYEEREKYVGKVYEINMKEKDLRLIDTKVYKHNVGRGAGFFINKNGHLYRPVQNSQEMYGKSLLFNEITSVEPKFIETTAFSLDNNKVKLNKKTGLDRVHTYSGDGFFEVIDYNNLHFDLFKRFKIIRRKRQVAKRGES